VNLEEARKLARSHRKWSGTRRGVACADLVLELADKVERCKEIEERLRYLVEAADNVSQPDYVKYAIEQAREALSESSNRLGN
jgi:hypothetical protein